MYLSFLIVAIIYILSLSLKFNLAVNNYATALFPVNLKALVVVDSFE